MFRILPILTLAAGCHDVYLAPTAGDAAPRASSSVCETWGGTYSTVVFTDEEAQNTIDFADNGSQAELEVMLGIGPSIANRIINARPYGTTADPLATLDAVTYVGPVLLGKFKGEAWDLWCGLNDGRQDCCVDLACEGLGGTFSNVDISDAEGQMLLDWANRAETDALEAACGIGPATALKIEQARPFHGVTELDAVAYISERALHRLVGHEDYNCTTEGSVSEIWCGTDAEACICDVPAPDPSGTLTIVHEDLASLPAGVDEVVNSLLSRTDWCDPTSTEATSFVLALEYKNGGMTTGFTVELFQWDPNAVGTAGFSIFVELDGDLNQTDAFCEQ